jgi:hypothetical protein
MKPKAIKLFATQIPYTEEELEEDEVYVEFNVQELLKQIDNEDVEDYARWSLDMKHEDDFESSLEDFSEDDIADYLEEEGYNFSSHIGEEDCIDFLEDSGYTVTLNKYVDNSLDYIDNRMLDEITEIFTNATVFEREEIYNKIKNRL